MAVASPHTPHDVEVHDDDEPLIRPKSLNLISNQLDDQKEAIESSADHRYVATEDPEEKQWIHPESDLNTVQLHQQSSLRPRKSLASPAFQKEPFKWFECAKYFVFIILFTIAAVVSRSSDSSNYRVTHQLKTLLFQENIMDHGPVFVDMVQESEMWDYIESLLLPRILTEKVSSGTDDTIDELRDRYLINTNNKLLGGFRVRAIRVEQEDCYFDDDLFPDCYPIARTGAIDIGGTLKGFDTFPDGIPYRTATENEDIIPWWGFQQLYYGDGYVVDILAESGLQNATEMIRDLRRNEFVDRSTRAMFIDFNTYNPTVNIHTVNRLAFEFPAAGGVMASYDFKSWQILRESRFLMMVEGLCLLFIVYFTYEEIRQFSRSHWKCSKHLKDRWNLIDFMNIIFFYFTITIRFVEYFVRNEAKLTAISEFESFRNTNQMLKIEILFQMVNGFILMIKLMKYMTFNPRIKFLFAILNHSAQDLFVFSIVLFVLFMAFGFAGFLLFSSDVEEFRTFPHSIINLVRFLISDLEYDTLTESSVVWGSIFYCLWGIVMILILANVFIAILTDAYMEVQKQRTESENIQFGALLRGAPKELMKGASGAVSGAVSGMTSTISRIGKTLSLDTRMKLTSKWSGKSVNDAFDETDKDHDGNISESELAAAANISKVEAREVIKSRDIDGDHRLQQAEFRKSMMEIIQSTQCEEQTTEELEPGTPRKSVKLQLESPDIPQDLPPPPPRSSSGIVARASEGKQLMECLTTMRKEMKENHQKVQESLDSIMMEQKQMRREVQQIKKRVIAIRRSSPIPYSESDDVSGRSKSVVALSKTASKRSKMIASMLDD